MSDDLAAFISARLDEDERYLRTMIEVGEQQGAAASPDEMADLYSMAVTLLSDPRARREVEWWSESPVPAPNDGKRMLSEIEVKRRMVKRATEARRLADGDRRARQNGPEWAPALGFAEQRERIFWEQILPYLGETWAAHPDYDPEWKP